VIADTVAENDVSVARVGVAWVTAVFYLWR
jgi:hypothetical protein